MITVCTAAQMRAAEERYVAGHPGVDLMQVAAGHVADLARTMIAGKAGVAPGTRMSGSRVLVLVGPGNNGGDGLFAAADLGRSGAQVDLCQVIGSAHPAGLAAATSAGCRRVSLDEVAAADHDLVIDAVLGIGGRPGIPDRLAHLGRDLRRRGIPVLSVDLPSGLDADSGEVTTAVPATETMTFASRKWCHVVEPASLLCGRVHVVDIGVEQPGEPMATVDDLARWWPAPGPRDDKYSRGVVGLDTGSSTYPGAAVLGVLGALRAGAGMVRFAGPQRAADLVLSRMPSVVVGRGRVQAWVVGSGWGPDADPDRLRRRVDEGVPVVVDADALRLLSTGRMRLPAGSLLTPHAGELARLLDLSREEVSVRPRESALTAAARWGATVLLKGSVQWVAGPDGQVDVALPGPAWTAQAGSGDVLAGICGSLLAAGLSARRAALAGASIQALTADRWRGPISPDALADHLPQVIGDLTTPARRV
ncbi:NAD(P)H-hydrate epimerase [Acidipropionibacterium timonense]|uniref:NAD(P)H-hydrate epimerase n=1 Tax=Acidipropionibacterium timonense TaxID=2161818 RepID=UPI0010315612|nr:NAD(P)H-hydrate epimerase [Acidipropionibacterium timonense]